MQKKTRGRYNLSKLEMIGVPTHDGTVAIGLVKGSPKALLLKVGIVGDITEAEIKALHPDFKTYGTSRHIQKLNAHLQSRGIYSGFAWARQGGVNVLRLYPGLYMHEPARVERHNMAERRSRPKKPRLHAPVLGAAKSGLTVFTPQV